jgi:hypothetical protein
MIWELRWKVELEVMQAFSNSMDVAKIMQLYLQKGNYANQQYFSKTLMILTCYFVLKAIVGSGI